MIFVSNIVEKIADDIEAVADNFNTSQQVLGYTVETVSRLLDTDIANVQKAEEKDSSATDIITKVYTFTLINLFIHQIIHLRMHLSFHPSYHPSINSIWFQVEQLSESLGDVVVDEENPLTIETPNIAALIAKVPEDEDYDLLGECHILSEMNLIVCLLYIFGCYRCYVYDWMNCNTLDFWDFWQIWDFWHFCDFLNFWNF